MSDPNGWFIEAHDPKHGRYYKMTVEGFALTVLGLDDNPKAQDFQVEFIKKFLEMETKLGPRNAQTDQFRKRAAAAAVRGQSTQFKVLYIQKFREMEAKLGPGARTEEFWDRWIPK